LFFFFFLIIPWGKSRFWRKVAKTQGIIRKKQKSKAPRREFQKTLGNNRKK
jgi:hypothetical protein